MLDPSQQLSAIILVSGCPLCIPVSSCLLCILVRVCLRCPSSHVFDLLAPSPQASARKMASPGARWVKRWRTKGCCPCSDGREQQWALLEVATPVFRDGPTAKRAKIEDPFEKASPKMPTPLKSSARRAPSRHRTMAASPKMSAPLTSSARRAPLRYRTVTGRLSLPTTLKRSAREAPLQQTAMTILAPSMTPTMSTTPERRPRGHAMAATNVESCGATSRTESASDLRRCRGAGSPPRGHTDEGNPAASSSSDPAAPGAPAAKKRVHAVGIGAA